MLQLLVRFSMNITRGLMKFPHCSVPEGGWLEGCSGELFTSSWQMTSLKSFFFFGPSICTVIFPRYNEELCTVSLATQVDWPLDPGCTLFKTSTQLLCDVSDMEIHTYTVYWYELHTIIDGKPCCEPGTKFLFILQPHPQWGVSDVFMLLSWGKRSSRRCSYSLIALTLLILKSAPSGFTRPFSC